MRGYNVVPIFVPLFMRKRKSIIIGFSYMILDFLSLSSL
jgi:hypothetical protein